MELITADDVGEILIYECPDCGHQQETRVETEDDETEDLPPLGGADRGGDDDLEGDRLEPDQDE